MLYYILINEILENIDEIKCVFPFFFNIFTVKIYFSLQCFCYTVHKGFIFTFRGMKIIIFQTTPGK